MLATLNETAAATPCCTRAFINFTALVSRMPRLSMRNDSREIAHAKMTIGPISSQQEKQLLLLPYNLVLDLPYYSIE